MKIALGMIVKDLVSVSPVLEFLENAKKFNHPVHSVIIAYSNNYDPRVIHMLEEYTNIHLVSVNHNHQTNEVLKHLDISDSARDELLFSNVLAKSGLTPYGFNRNTVLMEAILLGIDVLLFIDSDVTPYVLRKENEHIIMEEVDFVGTHLIGIKSGAHITTCGYSGYDILPPAEFEGMDKLLRAMQKANKIEFWETSKQHLGLTTQQNKVPQIQKTEKILGGNMAIDLSRFEELSPFYSPYYYIQDTIHLARGEDTLMTFEFGDKGVFFDIDMHIFHNTYSTYPEVPDLMHDPNVQNRFFHACMGWIGRNPFLNCLRKRNINEMKEQQIYYLKESVPHLISYTGNPIYNKLFDAIDISYSNLNRSIERYHRLQKAWEEFVFKAERGITDIEFSLAQLLNH